MLSKSMNWETLQYTVYL